MNAAAQFDAQPSGEIPGGQALATLANIGDLVEGRNRAIAHWLAAYDGFHTETALAAAASIGGGIGLTAPHGDRYSDDSLTRAFLKQGMIDRRDRETGARSEEPAREAFEKTITQTIDRRCWDALMKQLGFDQYLDRQAREEFQASLREAPPEFTVDNCSATFGHIWGNRREMYLRGIANVFMAMDRRFRSHDAFAIGHRLIIENAFNVWGSWENYNRRDTLRDVDRIFRELDGLAPLGEDHGDAINNQIYRERDSARRHRAFPALIEGAYFRVRAFQNGNLHLWFMRKDLLKQVNALLLEYYKPVEGDVTEGPTYEAGPLYHHTPAKDFGAFNSSDAVAEIVMQHARVSEGMRVLEPSAGTGVLARAARAKGARVICCEIQPGLAHELRAVHGFADVLQGDFLRFEASYLGQFDRIIMNPPFDRGRDCDHVRHAYQFLKPGGVLVAIMSARAEFGTDARHKALHDLIESTREGYRYRRFWLDLPERSFAHAGTNVNTVLLTLEKPKR